MLREQEIVKRIAKEQGLDERVVKLVANYPFYFVRQVMKDPNDLRPIRIKYFGLFVLKNRFYNGLVPKNYNKY